MGVRDRLSTSRASRRGWLLASVLVASAPLACKRTEERSEPPPPPADRLAPGESALSREKAFALPLPLGAKVISGYGGVVYVATQMSPEELSNFVRKRVTGGKITAGTSTTNFEGVTVAADPKRLLDIQVRSGRYVDNVRSELLIRDVTPAREATELKTDEERWRAAGLTQDGRVLHPETME